MTNDEPTRAEYYADVRALAREVAEQVRDGADLHDAAHEAADGSAWVIYTYRAHLVWRFSDSESAAFDEIGSDWLADCAGWSDVFARGAFYALRADVLVEYAEEYDTETGEPLDTDDEDPAGLLVDDAGA